jgi:citrate synthase
MEDIVKKLERLGRSHDNLSLEVIKEKNIKLGLRNADGTGIIAGITAKGRVVGYEKKTNRNKTTGIMPVEGKLYYCGYDVEDIVEHHSRNSTFGFEEVVYLLLTGELPSEADLKNVTQLLSKRRFLSKNERSVLMEEVQSENQMYGLHSVISHLGRCDTHPDANDFENVTRQIFNLIAKFPTIVAYNYNVMKYWKGDDLRFIRPKPELSTSENFLYMLTGRIPDKYEALIFDMALILHAEHGGGNNSTFTVRAVSSSGANTYMAIAAGIASLSGHLHGGANESVRKMMKDLMKEIKDWENRSEIERYLKQVLDKKKGDKSGKIYGLGHAVYTISDPRAKILKKHARELSKQKGSYEKFRFYENVAETASKLLGERYGKPISENVDFYSGFVYEQLGIPVQLYTPIFAMARVPGWSAHRLEQIVQAKILRPAYLAANQEVFEYKTLYER